MTIVEAAHEQRKEERLELAACRTNPERLAPLLKKMEERFAILACTLDHVSDPATREFIEEELDHLEPLISEAKDLVPKPKSSLH